MWTVGRRPREKIPETAWRRTRNHACGAGRKVNKPYINSRQIIITFHEARIVVVVLLVVAEVVLDSSIYLGGSFSSSRIIISSSSTRMSTATSTTA